MKQLKILLGILLTMVLMSIICSCRSIRYVPVESVRTEIQYKDRIQKDSIHVKDSVFMLIKGDTVLIEKYKDRWRDRLIKDTAYIYRNDTTRIAYPVEKPLSKWQQLKMDIGGISIGGIIVLLFIIIWLIIKTGGNKMQKRIGNDFTVTLNITRKGSPEDLTNASGITVVLQHMTCSFIRFIPNQITVNGSKISFPVTADQQKEPGKYRMLVKYHKTALDGIKTYTVDKCDIFELVSDDCGIDATDTDVVADIDVKIEQDGKDGLSAYELAVLNGYNGTLEDWLNDINPGSGSSKVIRKLKYQSQRNDVVVVDALNRRVPYNANSGQRFSFSGRYIFWELLRSGTNDEGFTHHSDNIKTNGIFSIDGLENATYISFDKVKLPSKGYGNAKLYVNNSTGDGIFETPSNGNYYDESMRPTTDDKAVYIDIAFDIHVSYPIRRISLVYDFTMETNDYYKVVQGGNIYGCNKIHIRNTPVSYIEGIRCYDVKPDTPCFDVHNTDITDYKEIRLRRVSGQKNHKSFAVRYRKVLERSSYTNMPKQKLKYPDYKREYQGFMNYIVSLVSAPAKDIIVLATNAPYNYKNLISGDMPVPRLLRYRKNLESIADERGVLNLYFDFEAYNYIVAKKKRVYSSPLRFRLTMKYSLKGGNSTTIGISGI